MKECLRKVQSFFESYANKTQLEMVYVWMDKNTKKRVNIFHYEKKQRFGQREENNRPCSVSTHKILSKRSAC